MNTARITFVNATGRDLESIRISGCSERVIPFLKAGDSTTVWISIPGDCSVEISYLMDGETRRETVAGYLTNFGGTIATYRIGSRQEILL